MKKLFLMGAVASLGLLASCSSDDDLSTGGNGKDGLQQIKIGMGVQANVATRGTGTVGAVGAENNTWAKQTVNVYMLNKGTLDVAMFGTDPIYENTVLTTPTDNASGIASELDEHGVAQYKYYPTTKTAFDFWGYRLDDADVTAAGDQDGSATAAAIKSGKFVPYTSEDSLLIGFQIDGTQDIMAGKAVPTEEEMNKCGGEENIYSAFAARRDVQPNIKFEHLLSRLNFQVLAGAESTTDANTGVKVTGITVKSKATGKLVIAYKGAAAFENVSDQLIVDKYENPETEAALYKDLVVKQRTDGAPLTDNLVDLTPVTPKWNNGMALATQVGEALLAIPADKYDITINLQQKVQVKGDKNSPVDPDDFQTKDYTYTAELKNTVNPDKGFEPGYSYNVTITVYGLSEIKITTTLIPWKDGGNIEMNPEDETFGATTANNAYEWAALEGDPTTTGATVEPTTYETLEVLQAAVAANASNSGKIYKVGTAETSWTYYQCKVKTTTPAPTVTFEFDTYTFQEGVDTAEEPAYGTLELLKAAVTADATTEGKIYKVGTSAPYTYYKVTKHTSGE